MNQQQKKLCQVCLSTPNEITLPCKHEFCIECIHGIVIDKMKSQDIKALKCPQQGCLQALTYDTIKTNLNKEEFERYCQLRFKLNHIEGLSENELMINCVNAKCDFKWVVWKQADYTTCLSCSQKSCLKCGSQFHEGLTCDLAKLNFTQSQTIFHNQAQLLGYQFCPHCANPSEKEKGCFFMTCESQKCKNNEKYFCFRCGIKLVLDDYMPHYFDRDPFKGFCLKKDKEGQWAVDVDNFEQVEPNLQACPECKTLDPKICEIIINFNSQVCFCKCVNKFFCLTCKEGLTEDSISYHLDDDFKCIYDVKDDNDQDDYEEEDENEEEEKDYQ